MVTLLCPVRGCGLPLERTGPSFECTRRHTFDIARSGYVNLLQSHDKRSSRPGDSKEAIASRRRFLDRGFEHHVAEAVVDEIARLDLGRHAPILDVGCGTGYYGGTIAAAHDVDWHGLDISAAAVDLAARAYPNGTWIVGNADRVIPFADGSFDVVLSITARRNSSEFRRVLGSSGTVLVVVPACDDLVELRELVLGRAVVASRVERVVDELRDGFALMRHREVRRQVLLDVESARDALAATYRGLRDSQRNNVSSLEALTVTLARDLLVFRMD
jgi:23S rRNA (guanine745-N1)-methyltransferase